MKQIRSRTGVWSRFTVVALLAAAVILTSRPAALTAAQEIIQATDQGWSANFRDHLTFTLNAESASEIVEVELFYRIVGRPATSRNQAEFTPGATITAQFVIDQTKPENYLPPGTELEYWWKITDAAGNELKTEKETLLYLDNRYNWQTLQNERLTLYWYEGGDGFGQALFDRANEALNTLETDMGIALDEPIKIFIYANHNDLLGAISTSAQEWTGGQAFTNYGVVVLGIQPGQLDWGLDATTHEMTHLVVHQATENPYGDLPRWLDEGIAVYNENPEELDDDFRAIFERAVRNNELMTLRTLSSPFPGDPLQANLAYGQSGAVVKFIIDTYGREAMANLLQIFSEGALYDEALEQALGVDTDGLDNAFRAYLELPLLPGAEQENVAVTPDTAPEESSESEPAPAEQAVKPAEPPEAGKTEPEPEAVASGGDTAAAETENAASPALPCLAGLLPLAALGVVALRRR